MDYDSFLSHFGTFGWFHFLLLVITCLAGSGCLSINVTIINFLGTRRDHWCLVPELVNHSIEDQLRLGIPWDQNTNAYATCSMYARPLADVDNDVNVTRAPEMPPEVSCQYGLSYDTSVRSSTYISEWGLVCDDAWMTDFVSPLFILGQFLGGLPNGVISNRLGRKRFLVLALLCSIAAGALVTFSVNFYMFVVSRFLVAVCSVNCLSLGYVLALEITPTKYRELATVVSAIMFEVGIFLISGLAYLITGWRALQLAAALVPIPIVILLITVVPESPRWLTWKDRRQEAADALAHIARFNPSKPSPEVLQKFCEIEKSNDASEQGPATSGTYREIFASPVTRRCALTISYSWMTTSFMLSAVTYNLDKLFGDIYINTAILGVVSITAKIMTAFAIHNFGRKLSLMVILVCAILMGILGAVGQTLEGWELAVTTSAILVRALGACGNAIGYVIMLELFPTPIRNLVMSLANGASYGSSMISPFVGGTLTEVWQPVAYVIYICMATIDLFLVSWLPECRGHRIPETIGELEALKSSKDAQKSEYALLDVKKLDHDNLAFHECIDCTAIHMDNLTLEETPQFGENTATAHPTHAGIFTIDEGLQKIDQAGKASHSTDSCSSPVLVDYKSAEIQL